MEGTKPNSWVRSTKIQNDHPSIVLQWEIKIEYQDNWWEITSSSNRNGTLNPSESERVYIEVDRSGKEEGEYWGYFTVEAHGTNYQYVKQVSLIMEVGYPESTGPDFININTNTGNTYNQLVLCFNEFIDDNHANHNEDYIISPSIDVQNVAINNDRITLTTSKHTPNLNYSITIPFIRDQLDRTSTDLTGEYTFYYCCAGEDLQIQNSSKKYEWDVVLTDKRIYPRSKKP